MKSVQRENVTDGLPRREPEGIARLIQWCFGAEVVHSMEASSWGRRLVGKPRGALVIPDYSSLAQLKGSGPPSTTGAASSVAAGQGALQAADGDLLPKARASGRPSTVDMVTPPASDVATMRSGITSSLQRTTATFDVAVDLPEAQFPARVESGEVGLESTPAVFAMTETGAQSVEPVTEEAFAVVLSTPAESELVAAEVVGESAGPEVAAVASVALDAADAPAVVEAFAAVDESAPASDLMIVAVAESASHAASTDDESLPAATLHAELLAAGAFEAGSSADVTGEVLAIDDDAAPSLATMAEAEPKAGTSENVAGATPAREAERAPMLMATPRARIDGARLRFVGGVVLPALVVLDASDTAAQADGAIFDSRPAADARRLLLAPGEVVTIGAWDPRAVVYSEATSAPGSSRLLPWAFVGAASALALAAAFMQPNAIATPAAANGAESASAAVDALAIATIETAPTAVPSPTGLAASLAVVNPANQPTATPLAELALLAGSMAGRAATGGGEGAVDPSRAGFPFNLDIVTPTPSSAVERLLFRDPLVAAERPDAAEAETDFQAPVVSLGQPIVLPALESERNGGAPIAALSLDELSRPRILPAMAVAKFPDIATPVPTALPAPTEIPIALAPGRAWSSFAPSDGTHFWVGRPHPGFVQNQIAAPSYQFGSTGGGRYRPHHGMDIANAFGTPVRAATTGEVVHAGLDDPDVLGPYPNFYGNAVVIKLDRRLAVAGGEMDVYLLYGHLSEVTVQKGQRVQPDDIVGMVGMTGIAIGPHLHVEMRVGANTYEASVNPYLWVEPPPGDGAVAVRLLSADGRTWPNARVTLARFEGNLATWARVLENYPDNESINPDPSFGETSAMDAVPAGVYYLVAVVNGERVAAEVAVEAGKTSFVEMRTQQ